MEWNMVLEMGVEKELLPIGIGFYLTFFLMGVKHVNLKEDKKDSWT